MVYASEEYPSDRRGTVIGVLQAFSSLGAIFCAGVTPFLLSTAYGWRTVYLVGVLPLVILAFARRNLKETQRFIDMKASGKQSSGDFFAILGGLTGASRPTGEYLVHHLRLLAHSDFLLEGFCRNRACL